MRNNDLLIIQTLSMYALIVTQIATTKLDVFCHLV